MQISYQNRCFIDRIFPLFQFYDLPFAVAFAHEPRVALIIHISNAIDAGSEDGSGPNVEVVGRLGRNTDEIGVQLFGMDDAITPQVMLGISR